ncbi:hypothetical protein ZEAMMB73_Zm00001d014417 [Zea mays]|jgi:hypothetical protein|uniref:Uncharacterized protein n=1 Tax=Zea mays TaxID=4577 RepID=A0A1D6GT29_MAIZE|nr:hypothetical protein ZEAMMB73_Zm00001d014417 [Zea mays]
MEDVHNVIDHWMELDKIIARHQSSSIIDPNQLEGNTPGAPITPEGGAPPTKVPTYNMLHTKVTPNYFSTDSSKGSLDGTSSTKEDTDAATVTIKSTTIPVRGHGTVTVDDHNRRHQTLIFDDLTSAQLTIQHTTSR